MKAQVVSIQDELKQRGDFQKALDFLGSGKTEVKFGQSEFQRLSNLFNAGADAQNKTANAVMRLERIFSRVFRDQARNGR